MNAVGLFKNPYVKKQILFIPQKKTQNQYRIPSDSRQTEKINTNSFLILTCQICRSIVNCCGRREQRQRMYQENSKN